MARLFAAFIEGSVDANLCASLFNTAALPLSGSLATLDWIHHYTEKNTASLQLCRVTSLSDILASYLSSHDLEIPVHDSNFKIRGCVQFEVIMVTSHRRTKLSVRSAFVTADPSIALYGHWEVKSKSWRSLISNSSVSISPYTLSSDRVIGDNWRSAMDVQNKT